MQHSRAVVWVDAREARVFEIEGADREQVRIRADAPRHRLDNRAGSVAGSDRVRDNREFFERILAALEDAEGWMIAGPDETRNDLRKYLDTHAEDLRTRLVGVYDMPKPSDEELSSLARTMMTEHTRSV